MHTCRPHVKGFEAKKQTYGPSLIDILEDIIQVFNVSHEIMIGKRKKDEHVAYRQVYIHAATQLTDARLVDIGAVINKDHTSVIHHRELCKDYIKCNDSAFINIWNKYVLKSKVWGEYFEVNECKDQVWLDAIKSSLNNNNKDYTTVPWMQLETGKPTKKVMYELQKLVKNGILIREESKKGIRYKLKTTNTI